MNLKTLIDEIKREEGFCTTAYKDSLGKLTIGYGRLIDQGGGITQAEAEYLLSNDITKAITQLDGHFSWYKTLSDARQRALANMCFQLGLNGLLKFHGMIAALERGDYETAHDEALNSLWAKQTPARALRMADMIRAG